MHAPGLETRTARAATQPPPAHDASRPRTRTDKTRRFHPAPRPGRCLQLQAPAPAGRNATQAFRPDPLYDTAPPACAPGAAVGAPRPPQLRGEDDDSKDM